MFYVKQFPFVFEMLDLIFQNCKIVVGGFVDYMFVGYTKMVIKIDTACKKKEVDCTDGGGEIYGLVEKNSLWKARFLDGSPIKEEDQVFGFKDWFKPFKVHFNLNQIFSHVTSSKAKKWI